MVRAAANGRFTLVADLQVCQLQTEDDYMPSVNAAVSTKFTEWIKMQKLQTVCRPLTRAPEVSCRLDGRAQPDRTAKGKAQEYSPKSNC